MPSHQERPPAPVPGRRVEGKRAGSRLLLAASLAAGVAGAIFAGARVADFVGDHLGVTSTVVRLALKVACIAAFLPVGFYLVERYFLSQSPRGR